MRKQQIILDACCGGRMFLVQQRKSKLNCLFIDEREVEKSAFPNGWDPKWCVKTDVVADF